MRRIAVLAAVLAMTLSGCGTGSEPSGEPGSTTGAGPATGGTPAETTATTDADTGTLVTTEDSEFGEMLFDGRGQAIYLFDRETSSEPECYDACAAAWPPVLTDGAPRAGGDAEDDLLGTTERADGSVQVTYAGRPLYFYADEDPGEVKCHNVDEYGGLWLVVTPGGEAAPA
ncbi:Predicted lipoprotein with conserved Yx(FWY)xxD motif [Haloechinothrix alba]|uniref:Predicted lipoprotein with conserved Yx(FWY)xxD motif n=1 Tax=Haloechinothrix alba TaxID=664784 RepID=A0A238W893_9PSEU|nr:hypothetical protein [Haloechinothrix alba]SNR42728.1 Predicted lipoprotein with conserved Yx(FWY)xxD motif [Haloechinothrix alba]